jgi:hypothetical protein
MVLKRRRWKPTLVDCLKVLAWLNIVLALVIVAGGVFVLFVGAEQWQRVLPVFAIALATAGVLLTLAGHLFAQARDVNEARDKRSLFYFQSCLTAYEEAQALLEDGNNDRVTWIAAGRALGHAKELSKLITQDPHLRALELHQLKYRGFFYGCLQPKTAAFFYGARDSSMPINDAAAASTAPAVHAGRHVGSTVNALSSKALRAIWEAAQWPTTFQDPLKADFSEQEQGSIMVIFPGLHEYLEHTRAYTSAGGKLIRRNSSEA